MTKSKRELAEQLWERIAHLAWESEECGDEEQGARVVCILSAALETVAARCAEIADEQLEYWREEKRLRGNYRVRGGINECQRVADAIRAEFGLRLR